MLQKCSFLLAALLLSAFSPVNAVADQQPATAESRLRDALRNTMQQLQDAQGQVATLQATQAQSDKDNADLKTKVEGLTTMLKSITDQAAADKAASDKAMAALKQSNQDLTTEMVDTLSIQINLLNKQGADDKATLDKSIADMKSKNPDLDKALTQYGADIQLWKTGYYQYVQFAGQTETARAKLAADTVMLRRLVDDRETKNLALYNTASEILTRYEKYSLGEALAAKEPFIGITRVKIQEDVQDYKDKILDEKIKIGQPAAPIAPATASTNSTTAPAAKPAMQATSAMAAKP